MPYPAGKWRGRKCTVCTHPEAGRIDFLLVSGSGEHGKGRRSLAEKFGLGADALQRHAKHHISAEYRRAILAGPLHSEQDLRELVAQEGQSVLVNFRSLFNAHRQRWLVALESGDDLMMIAHSKTMTEMLTRIGRLTQEIAPPQTFVQNNTVQIFEHPEGAHSRRGRPPPPLPRAQSAHRRESATRQSYQRIFVQSGHIQISAAASRPAPAAGRTPNQRRPRLPTAS